jgi:hypothetical protein
VRGNDDPHIAQFWTYVVTVFAIVAMLFDALLWRFLVSVSLQETAK